jgi:peptidylprolyl isomerase
VRKTSAVLATLSLAVLALTGCTATASDDGAACDRSGGNDKILNVADVTGELGTEPDVSVFGPVKGEETSFADVTVGDGLALTTEFQPVVIDIAFYAGDSGKKLYASEFNGDLSRVHSIDYWAQRSPGLTDVLECATGGSRVLAVLTPEDFGPQNVEGFGLDKGENVVAVVDVLDVMPSRASGALQFNDAQGLPTVVRAPDGTPGIIIPDVPAPTEIITQTLIKGDGPEVEAGDTVVTNIMGVGWDDKKVTTNSWGAEPSIGAAAEQFIGATVGSQLLVVLPASEGSPATAIVVDILGAVTAPTP